MTKTRSLKKVNSTGTALFMVILLLALVIVFGVNSKPVDAESTYTVSGQYVANGFNNYTDKWASEIEAVPNQVKTTFSLYKVGHYENVDGKSVIALDPPFNNVTLPTKSKEEYSDENAWIKDWLAAAQTMSMRLDGQTPVVTTGEVTGNKPFSLGGITEKGLYLLVGTSCEFDMDGQTVWWRPQPMLIQVFDGSNTTVNVKPECETSSKFRVTKYWACPNQDYSTIESSIRPASVTVRIYYDRANNSTPVYTEELNAGNSWTFEWKANQNQKDPTKWTVEEEALGGEAGNYYTYTVESPGTATSGGNSNAASEKLFKVTNTFNPPKLKIIKKLDNYLNNSDNVSTTFAFEVTGYKNNAAGAEEQVYHKYVSLKFDADGKLTNEKEVNYIPVGLSKLVVREVESPNYTVDQAVKTYTAKAGDTDDITFDGNLYTVSFKNTFNGETHFDGGVINHFNMNGNTFKPGTPEGKTHNKN